MQDTNYQRIMRVSLIIFFFLTQTEDRRAVNHCHCEECPHLGVGYMIYIFNNKKISREWVEKHSSVNLWKHALAETWVWDKWLALDPATVSLKDIATCDDVRTTSWVHSQLSN